MTAFEKNYLEIIEIISAQRRRKLLLQLSKGLFYLVGFIGLSILLSSLLDIIFKFEPSVRFGIIIFIVTASIVLFSFQMVLPVFLYWQKGGKYSIETIAFEMGERFEELRDDLVNAIQVYHSSRKNKENYSLDLAAHAVGTILNLIKGVQVSRLYSNKAVKKAGRFLISPVLIAILVFGIFPQPFSDSLSHMLNPTVQYKPTPVNDISVLPGDITKVEGDSCDIQVKIEGVYAGPISLSLKEKSREVPDKKILQPDSTKTYFYRIKNLRVPVEYFVEADNKSSATFEIKVEKRPFIRKLNIRLDYPQYTELPFRYQDDNVGDVTALMGTRVKLQIASNKSLKEARLVFRNGRSQTMKISDDEANVVFPVRKDGSYKIELVDEFGYSNLNPIEYLIRALEDQYPMAEIVSPGRDVDLNEEMKLPLTIEAEDDFGFSRLRIGYRVETSMQMGLVDTTYHYVDLPVDGKKDTKLTVDYLWELLDLRMMPEDILYYFAEVWDNDEISGPKRSISRVYTARFPSVYEIFEEVARGDDENIDKLEEVLNESKDLKDRLDEISRELTQQQQMDWLKKQDIEEIAQKQQNLQKSVDEVRQELEQMVERLEENQMLSFETLKKFQELQELFKEIMTPELQKAMEELRKAAEELNESKLKQALNKMQISQENLLQNLERTVNLLKRLQLEQRIDQATKLTENLTDRQKMLNEQLKNSSPKDVANMLHQQQKLEEDAKSLNEMLSNLDEELEKEAQFQSETMDSLLQEIQKAKQGMQNSQQNMQQGKMQKASQSGEMTEQSLQQMLQQLKNLKKDFNRKQKQEFAEEFSKASNEMMRLSQSQEELMQQTQKLSNSSPQLGEMAENQQQQLQHLGRVTDDLYQLSQKTFFVTPEIGKAIGKAMSGMQRALQQLEQRNSRGASGQQGVALGGLNESVMQIQQAMQNMQGSGSGSGFEEFMKRLQQMTGQQQGINQQTMQMGMQQGQMSLQQQAAMARLAAEQEAVRKSLEQLQKEFGNRSEITGRMDGIAKEMEDVVKDLQRKQVNPRTIDRQKRILSRMLDAQRSMNQRDYSKKRQATSGKTYFVRSPEDIDEKIKQQKERFLEDLIRARKTGFNSDYLELIRNYFKVLTETEKKQVENE